MEIGGPTLFSVQSRSNKFIEETDTYLSSCFSELGLPLSWSMDRFTKMANGSLVGIYLPCSGGVLTHCVSGRVQSVAMDLRKDRPTFGNIYSVELSGTKMVYVPFGFGYGNLALEPSVMLQKYTSQKDLPMLGLHPFQCGVSWDWNESNISVANKDHATMSLVDYEKIKL